MMKRMNQLFESMNGASIGLVFSGTPAVKSADQTLPFQVNKNFYYLTGLTLPNQVLVLIKGNSNHVILYAESRTKDREKWDGRLPSFDMLSKQSGITDVRDKNLFEEDLKGFLSNQRTAVFGEIDTLYMDLSLADRRVSPEVLFVETFKKDYPDIQILNYQHTFKRLRTIKSDEEVKIMQQAINITANAIDSLIQAIPKANNEHEIHQLFKYEISKSYGKEAFDTIIASGGNATILHYIENNDALKSGDLVLMDLGAASNEYNADITRTVPISGTFTERQKVLYQLVLEVNEAMIEWIAPGKTFQAFREAGKQLLAKKARAIGLIHKEEDIINYYYHGLGHHLGLDVHDPCDYDMVMTPGMVITVEPGIYIEEENIGIRIEDDVLVTETGAKNLSAHIPKSIDAIEKLMSKK